MNKIDGGTRYAKKIAKPVCLAPLNRSLSMAYAASTDAKSEKNVEVTETRTVFHIHCGYSVLKSNFSTCASVGLIIKKGLPSRDSNSLSGLNAVMPIQ